MTLFALSLQATLTLDPVLDVTPRYIVMFGEDTNYLCSSDVLYTSAFADELIYISTTRPSNMPKGTNPPPIDMLSQRQTITLDFGAGPFLPDGVTLTGTPTVTLSVVTGDDPDPASRITAGPQIGVAPPPYGSGRADCAVLVQLGDCPGPGSYLLQCVCGRTDDDVAPMDVIITVREPGS